MSLKVYYPHGGKHFLLHWWTYNDRGHIVLSRTEAGISIAAAEIFNKHHDAEIRDYLEIEIVGPSNLMRVQEEHFTLQDKIESFWGTEILWRLKNLLQAGKELPPQFQVCASYEPEDEEEFNNDWAQESHYSCKNCIETIKMIGMDKTSLYEKYHEAWYKIHPMKSHVDKKLIESRAEIAKDDEELYFAGANFGHHSSGIDLDQVDISKASSDYRPMYLYQALFFYRKVREMDSSQLESILLQEKKRISDQREKQGQEQIDKLKREKQADIEATLAFFKENG